MAAASANGGAIGGNAVGNGIHQDGARPQPRPQRQEHAGAAELRALRCVSPEPIQYEDSKMSSHTNSPESIGRTEIGLTSFKKRRLGP
jgi:hypothetical protein